MPTIVLHSSYSVQRLEALMLYPEEPEGTAAMGYVSEMVRRDHGWLAHFPVRPGGGLPISPAVQSMILTGPGEAGDVDWRAGEGLKVGEMFLKLYFLVLNRPDVATWENAIRLFQEGNRGRGNSAQTLRETRDRYLTVAHLWGAYLLGHDKWAESTSKQRPSIRLLVAEAMEMLRAVASHKPKRNPHLDMETMWVAPEGFVAPPAPEGWPALPDLGSLTPTPKDLAKLGRVGRPRKAAVV